MRTPEETARELIDAKLVASGWVVQSYRDMNLGGGPGLAVTEFPGAHGPADYLLYADGRLKAPIHRAGVSLGMK